MAAMLAQRASTAFTGKNVQRQAAARVPAGRKALVCQAAADRKLWAPNVVAPTYLNGTLAGDYGWDPLVRGRGRCTPRELRQPAIGLSLNLQLFNIC